MSAIGIWVRPMEPVFAGPPRSLPRGEAHGGDSLFPPPPRTFMGLVRTRLLRDAYPPLDLADTGASARAAREALVGSADRLPECWQVEGPFPLELRAEDEGVAVPWLPAPLFLRRVSGGNDPSPVRASLFGRPDAGAEGGADRQALDDLDDLFAAPGPQPRPWWGTPGRGPSTPLGGWIDADALLWALGGTAHWPGDEHRGEDLPPFVRWERTAGVAIDPARGAAQDAMLYFRERLRFAEGSGLAAWLTAPLERPLRAESLVTGTGRLGGKGGAVTFTPLPRPCAAWEVIRKGDHLPHQVQDGERFTLSLLTPARFQDVTEARTPPISAADGVEVVAEVAMLGRPLTLGGFDLARRRPMDNRRYVPAGSAWVVSIRGGDDVRRAAALRSLNGSHALGDREEARFGFGHVVVGRLAEEGG